MYKTPYRGSLLLDQGVDRLATREHRPKGLHIP